MTAEREVLVPDIGDFKDVDVIDILVKPGDAVQVETPLITIESDKAAMELPSPYAGIVKDIRVKVGEKVAEGSAILVLSSTADDAPAQKRTRKGTQGDANARVDTVFPVKRGMHNWRCIK